MAIEDVMLFEPKQGKEMKTEYPELAEITEFAVLRDAQIRFVWYYASSCSDIKELHKEQRIKVALERSKYDLSLRGKELSDTMNGRFLPEISAAVKKMESFQPSLRARSKTMLQQMFDNIEDMAKVPKEIDGKPINEVMEFSDRKAYVDFAKNSIGVLDDLIVKIEQSGVTKKTKQQEKGSGPNLMDRVIHEG